MEGKYSTCVEIITRSILIGGNSYEKSFHFDGAICFCFRLFV